MTNETPQQNRLLIADDCAETRQRLVDRLLSEVAGLAIVGPAADGREALQLFERHEVHGAILDLQMPALSGLEVLEAIRERSPTCLIIVLTVHVSEELRTRCLQAGANFFLHKARDFDAVAPTVSSFFEMRP